MVRGKALQEEVRAAVKDYLADLITQRSAGGGGMAVSANDLLVAAKSAGQRSECSKAVQASCLYLRRVRWGA